ncbi:MAG TPA: hypothetical protein EYG09_06650 [Dehalococcoidia bacterium]|nr:hypothetical protein [Dehalococcoidia bacterium]
MRDPRIDEIIERIGETDSKGKPNNKVADMARQVNDFLFEIEKLRSEVETATRQVVYLSGREQSMRQSGGAVARTPGSSALAPRVDEIEQNFGYQRERLETVTVNLKARQGMVKSTQQLIAARISSVQQILDAYSSSYPKELKASAGVGASGSGAAAAATSGTGKKKIVRRRRVVRRRR